MKIILIIGTIALITVGSGMYTGDSGKHAPYFSEYLENSPSACKNCHVMDTAYESWFHSDHKNRATCSDCHLPADFVPKYLVKAESGIRDVTAIISGNIPETIRATESSQKIIQENCLRCHAQTVEKIADGEMDSERYCFDCHRSVAHGERGISISPYQERT